MAVELLAPAKDKETAKAAIDCGADAVYIGAPNFGARKSASNTLEDIKEVVEYAHKFWARVHITINTILTDDELKDAYALVRELEDIGADAVIIQDMGLLKLLIDNKIKIPVHMSTQCDNYLPEKVKFFNDIGVSRVILARELSVEQVADIHKENPDLELETFIHGALCVSMSGQCYLSQYIGGRSANRGECAQPCRKKYSVLTDDGKVLVKDTYALCLKDFNGSKCIDDLIDAGICSFKIEGRLKDIGYVKNIVSYYRAKLGRGTSSGKSEILFKPNPEKSFNRGFTEYFLNGRTDCFNFESPKSRGEYLGRVTETGDKWIRTDTDKVLSPQDGLYFSGDGAKVNKTEGDKIFLNRHVNIMIGTKIYRNYDAEFEQELKKPVKRQIGAGVNVCNNIITVTDEDGVTIRHEITGDKANNPENMKETFVKQFSKTGEEDFYIKEIKIESELPFMPVSAVNNLRRTLFAELMAERLKVYESKIKQTQGTMEYSPYFLNEIDYRGNVHNSSAEEFYNKCGCKVTERSFESHKPERTVELMRCKHCIKYALNMCKSPQKLLLRDDYGKLYPLKFNCEKCEMSVISPD